MTNNLTIIKDSYEAGARGDIGGLLADLAENCEWTEMAGCPYSGTYRGRDEVIENVFKRLAQDWNPFECVPGQFYDAGDTIVVTGWYSGKHTTTGKSFKIRFSHIWQLFEGKIKGFEQFTDTALMRESLA